MIKLCDITKQYGDHIVLDHVDYTFPQTGLVCLTGPSGEGKTTLLNLMAGFDTQYQGQIKVDNWDLTQLSPQMLCDYRRSMVGFVFQNYHLLPEYTVLENLCLSWQLVHQDFNHAKETAITLLTQLGIAEKQDQKVATLSGGQKQRVAIGRALMSNPKILFADEPTGALDRSTSNEIMCLLQNIAKERLVIVITHDEKVSAFAQQVLRIEKGKIIPVSTETAGQSVTENPPEKAEETRLNPHFEKPISNHPLLKQGFKNFKTHFKRYFAIACAISLGITAFLYALSFDNVTRQSIEEFQQKNTAFNNGYIQGDNLDIAYDLLHSDNRIHNIYYQYTLENITLSFKENAVHLAEKLPLPKANEIMSYGVMPQKGKHEIALSPSLAKKFASNIQDLIGQNVQLQLGDKVYTLCVSGIYNAGYDDFFISSDIEQELYPSFPVSTPYAISYDIISFDDIIPVTEMLGQKNIYPVSAVKEVTALSATFQQLKYLFLIISLLILVLGIFICSVLLIKLQNNRSREMGLLAALGFYKSHIQQMIQLENLLISLLAGGVNFILLIGSLLAVKAFNLPFAFHGMQIFGAVVGSFIFIIIISSLASRKILRMDPATALKE